MNLLFPILMTLFVTGIVLCKEIGIERETITKTQKNIWFLLEPFIYITFVFSWVYLLDVNVLYKILLSISVGILLFIGITAYFMGSMSHNEKVYQPEELIGLIVQIEGNADNDTHYLGKILGDNIDIVIASEETLYHKDLVKITEISGTDIIAKKIG